MLGCSSWTPPMPVVMNLVHLSGDLQKIRLQQTKRLTLAGWCQNTCEHVVHLKNSHQHTPSFHHIWSLWYKINQLKDHILQCSYFFCCFCCCSFGINTNPPKKSQLVALSGFVKSTFCSQLPLPMPTKARFRCKRFFLLLRGQVIWKMPQLCQLCNSKKTVWRMGN